MATLDLTQNIYDFRLEPGDLPSFWPRWGPLPRGYFVTATLNGSSWSITDSPGTVSVTTDEWGDADYVWRGGVEHTFTDVDGLASALSAKGYTVT